MTDKEIIEWVEVSDRLPEKDLFDVVILTNYGKKIADYDKEHGRWMIHKKCTSFYKKRMIVLEWLDEKVQPIPTLNYTPQTKTINQP